MGCLRQALCFGSRASPSSAPQPRPTTSPPTVPVRQPSIHTIEDVLGPEQAGTDPGQEASASSAQIVVIPDQTLPIAQSGNLWNRAYDRLKDEDPTLFQQFENRLPLVSAQSVCFPIGRAQLERICFDGRNKLDEEEARLGKAKRAVERTSRAIIWAQGVIGKALSASPEASLAWACVTLILPLFTNVTTVDEANKSGFTYVTARLEYYIAFETGLNRLHQDSVISPELVAAITENTIKLYLHILDFQIRSVIRFSRGVYKNLPRDAVDYDEWAPRLRKVQELESLVDRDWRQTHSLISSEHLFSFKQEAIKCLVEIGSLSSELVTAAHEHRDLLQEQVDFSRSKDEDDCLQVFRRVADGQGAGYEWYKDRVQERVKGTCKWFLSQRIFKRWLARDSGPLLVSADPGCGKSVLSRYLIDKYLPEKQPGAIICYFFFKDQDQDTITLALCAILHQLLSRHSRLIREHALKVYRKEGKNLAHTVHSLWDILADTLRDPQMGPVVLVLDALDECNEADIAFFTKSIRQLFSDSALSRHFKCLLTTRPYERITSGFRNMTGFSNKIHIPGEDKAEAIGQEISLVIRHRVDMLNLSFDEQQSLELRKILLRRLIDIQHRTYLWVHLIFDYLTTTDWTRTKGGLEQAIRTLPQSVNEAYEKILSKANASPSVRKILTIVLGAARPLSLVELNIAFNMKDNLTSYDELEVEPLADFKFRLRDFCGLFISIDQNKVYFLHQTAREFLLDRLPSSELAASPSMACWRGTFSMDEADTLLARLCMAYLLIVKSSPEVLDPSVTPYMALQRLMSQEFFVYAFENWKKHVKNSSNEPAMTKAILLISDPEDDLDTHWHVPSDMLIHDNSRLELLAGSGLYHAVKAVLEENDHSSPDGQVTLVESLKACIEFGETRVATLLLEYIGSDLLRSFDGLDLLDLAYDYDDDDMINMLISRGTPSNLSSMFRHTPLAVALREGNMDCVELLLDKGVLYFPDDMSSDRTDHDRRWRPETLNCLVSYQWSSSLGVLPRLCTPNFDINQADCAGVSLLSYATYFANIHAAAFLVKKGADIDTRDIHGRTPLFRIVEDWTLRQQIIGTASPDVIVRRQEGELSDELSDAVQVLLKKQNPWILTFPEDQGNLFRNSLRWLLEQGADPSIGDFDGQLPLDIADAVRDKNPEPSEILREYGAKGSLGDDSAVGD